MHEKSLRIVKRAVNKANGLRKEEKVAINKRTAGIIHKVKNLPLLLKKIKDKCINDKKHCRVRDHCHSKDKCRSAAHSIYNLKYSIPKKIPVLFHNEFNYHYHFYMRQLAKTFEGEYNCLEENKEKVKSFKFQ